MPRLPFPALCLLAGSALATLGACSTTPTSGPVEVTRFHRIDALHEDHGTIRVIAATGNPKQSPDDDAYIAAVARELAKYHFRVLASNDASAEAIARVRVTRTRFKPERNRSRVSVGGGGAAGSYGSGVGLGIGIDLTGTPPEQIDTHLVLTIDDAASNQRVWEGRAQQTVTVKSPFAAPEASAQHLAQALLKDFPGASGETIQVK